MILLTINCCCLLIIEMLMCFSFQQVDLTLHVEESFIHYCFNTKETTETVQCNERDSNKLLKKQNNQTNTHRVSSMLQSIKKLYMDPKGEYEDNLNEGKHHLVRR